jgi:2-desacetyl-2-hydroxyethyl bacteriochlorophyllide A dehydrogenase
MKAAVLTEFNKVEILERDIPAIISDEVLVKVKYNGICGTDIHVMQGHHPAAKPPLVMGHEFCGTIEKKGANVLDDIEVGERVIVQPYESCGECEACKSGSENVCDKLKIFGVHRDGAFQEYVNVKATRIFKLDDSVSDVAAALIEPLAVAVHDVKKSGLQVGGTAAIIGGGPIGLLIAIVARINGASEIIISEINPVRIKKAEEMGFTVINPAKDDLVETVAVITRGRGFDVVFEVSGSKQGILSMTQLVKTSGTVVTVGIPADKYPVDTDTVFKKEIKIVGVRLYSKVDFQAAVNIMKKEEQRNEILNLVTAEYPLAEINDAFKHMRENSDTYKVLIKIAD